MCYLYFEIESHWGMEMALLHTFFQKIPMAALFLSVAIASVGLATGPQAIAQIKQYGVTLPIIGICVALVPCLVMVFYGRFVLKMNPVIICGAITGNLTCTPGLNGLMDLAKSNTPVLGYTVSYAISNVLLTFLGPIIVFAV
jgi:uncharacterized transporter YbjL